MKKEDLFESIGSIDDDLIQKSEKRNHRSWYRWGAVAACFALIVGLLIYGGTNIARPNAPILSNKSEENMHPNENIAQTSEPYVDIKLLLASNSTEMKEAALKTTKIEISEYQAVYEGVLSVESDMLKKSIGKQVANSTNAYYVSGHEDLQYIICSDEEEYYTLWKFQCFDSKEYAYKEVLKKIYNVQSADNFLSILSEPATTDNTDEGIKLQKEIGKLTSTDSRDLTMLYNIISSLICYGNDNWDRIDYGGLDENMLDSVKYGRYLTINTSSGCIIDDLKYTGISGMFYGYTGIAYKKLDEKNQKLVEQILQIDRGNRGSIVPKDNSTSSGQTNYIDRDTRQETYSEEYLNELQNKISSAMQNGEFQCVSSSALMDGYILVSLTQECMQDIKILKNLDKIGGAIELEYSKEAETLE